MDGVGKVTLQTIADAVGVSRMTVSNAFSRPDQLSADLRERILSTAKALHYAGPDPAARGLARGTAGAVGVLLTDSVAYAFADELTARFVGGIAEELAPTGLALTLLTSSGQADRIPARDVPLDGALIYSCHERSIAVDWLVRRDLPLVFVDQTPRTGFPSVNIDDRGGARLAGEHLANLGHRHVGIITSYPDGAEGILDDPRRDAGSHVGRERVHGWLEGLEPAGVQATVVQFRSSGEEAGREGAAILLDLDEPPTAVLCVSDVTAYGVMQVAAERGLSVPDDLSVVGFDDGLLAARMKPGLTTVRQDATQKGKAAAAALIAAMKTGEGSTARRPKRVRLPTELVVRATTAPPPGRRRARKTLTPRADVATSRGQG
jgi:DNA-binding LacI/PurR family transcriptional regulator